jgi:DNA polymerase-3 subunit alpha
MSTQMKDDIIGVSDECTLSSIPSFLDSCAINKVFGIVGISINILDDNSNFLGILNLIAKNNKGYEELCEIVSASSNKSTQLNNILQFNNIIVIDGSKNSILYNCLKSKYNDSYFKKLEASFKNDYWLTIQFDDDIKQNESTQYILSIYKKYHKKILISKNNRFMCENEKILLQNKFYLENNKNKTLDVYDTTNLFKFEHKACKYISLTNNHKTIYQNINRNNLIVTKSTLLESISKITTYNLKEILTSNDDRKLRQLVREKWSSKKKQIPARKHSLYAKRLSYEINTIEDLNFDDYFNLIHEIYLTSINLNGISIIRGSGVSSLIFYVLGLSNIDPIKHSLMFDRFLTKNRKELPDVDLDVSNANEVLCFLNKKYNVAHLSKFVKMTSYKNTILFALDSLRRFGGTESLEESEYNIFNDPNFVESIKYTKKENRKVSHLILHSPYWKNQYNNNDKLKKIFTLATLCENKISHKAINSSSVVFSKYDFNKKSPLILNKTNTIGKFIEFDSNQNIYLKLDLLSNLNLKKNNEITKNNFIDNINHSNKEVYRLLSKGNTYGINQLKTKSATYISKEISPKCFEDLIAINALIRFGYVDENTKSEEYSRFITNKLCKPKYLCKKLENILSETNGVLLYEEQILRILIEIGKLKFTDADDVRVLLKNKKNKSSTYIENEILKYKDIFTQGAIKNGIKDKINDIFNMVLKKAGKFIYSKAHSAAYADIIYQQMILKIENPSEFMDVYCNTTEEYNHFILELHEMKIKIVSPCINKSNYKSITKKHDGEIIPSIIKCFSNSKVLKDIIHERKINGEFSDVINYIERVFSLYTKKGTYSIGARFTNVMKKDFINLINCGAFDIFLPTISQRKTYSDNVDQIFNFILDGNTNILNIGKNKEYYNRENIINLEKNVLYYSPYEINENNY